MSAGPEYVLLVHMNLLEYSWGHLKILLESVKHRAGRVLSFFSSRRNWDSPNPSSAGECVPPRFRGERHTRWRERGRESPNSDEGTYTVVLFIYMYFVVLNHKCDCEETSNKDYFSNITAEERTMKKV